MTLNEFVRENRGELEDLILRACSNCVIYDIEDIEDWVMNDEPLYRWAIETGVEFDE